MDKQIVDMPDYVKDTKSGAVLLKPRKKTREQIKIEKLENRVKILEEDMKQTIKAVELLVSLTDSFIKSFNKIGV